MSELSSLWNSKLIRFRQMFGFRQVFDLPGFKLHINRCQGTLKSVRFRQVFRLFIVWFRQVFRLFRFGLDRFQIIQASVQKYFRLFIVWFKQVFRLFRVWFRQVFRLFRLRFRQVFRIFRIWFQQVFGLFWVCFRQVSL